MKALTVRQPRADIVVAWQLCDWVTSNVAPQADVLPGLPHGEGPAPGPLRVAVIASDDRPIPGPAAPDAYCTGTAVVYAAHDPQPCPTGVIVGTAVVDTVAPILHLHEDRPLIDRAMSLHIPHFVRSDMALTFWDGSAAHQMDDLLIYDSWAYRLAKRRAITPTALPQRPGERVLAGGDVRILPTHYLLHLDV